MADSRKVAVYVSLRTLLKAIETLEDGLPPRIDTSVFNSFSVPVRSHLLSAFKFLGLIDDDGHIQEALAQLIRDKESRAITFSEVCERSYKEIVKLAEETASQRDLDDAMRVHGVQGATLEKAVRFYLQAAEYAGLPVSPLWRNMRGRSRPTDRARRATSQRATRASQAARSAMPENGYGGSQAERKGDEDILTAEFSSEGSVILHLKSEAAFHPDFVFSIIDKVMERVAQYETKAAPSQGQDFE